MCLPRFRSSSTTTQPLGDRLPTFLEQREILELTKHYLGSRSSFFDKIKLPKQFVCLIRFSLLRRPLRKRMRPFCDCRSRFVIAFLLKILRIRKLVSPLSGGQIRLEFDLLWSFRALDRRDIPAGAGNCHSFDGGQSLSGFFRLGRL